MFTYKFLGLSKADAETPYYYGSLPAKAERGQTLRYDDTGNRYEIYLVEGEGLEGNGPANEKELAWADINRGESVPTIWLRKLRGTKAEKAKNAKKVKVLRKAKHFKAKYFESKEVASIDFKKAEAVKKDTPHRGRSFDADDVKGSSRRNRKIRLSKRG